MDQYDHDPFAALTGEELARQRNNARDSLFLTARMTIGGRQETVRVRNLSSGGMMAEQAATAPIGTAVDVDLRGIGVIPGRIAWATDGRIGIAFDRTIDPKLARKRVTGRNESRDEPRRF